MAKELLLLLMLTLSSSLSLLLSLSCLFYFIVKSVPRKFAERLERSGAAVPPSRCAPRALPQDDLGAGAPQYPRLPGFVDGKLFPAVRPASARWRPPASGQS